MPKYKKSPYNPQSDLFKALTKLFSGPITQRRTQTGRMLRRRQLDNYATKFKSASGAQFKKWEYNPINSVTMNMITNRNRAERYVKRSSSTCSCSNVLRVRTNICIMIKTVRIQISR